MGIKRKRLLTVTLTVFMAILIGINTFASPNIPKNPRQLFAYDEVGILSKETSQYINHINLALKETGAQIVVSVVKDLGGYDIESYANEMFREWGIGDKEKNNGVLLLVAPDERKLRIEVGYGLEGAIPDGKAGRIIRNEITPYFKNNQYDEGIINGTKAILALVQEEYGIKIDNSIKAEDFNYEDSSKESPIEILVFMIIVFFVLFGKGRRGRRGRRRHGSGYIWPMILSNRDNDDDDDKFGGWGGFGGGSGGGGFGGGSSGGGGASGGW